MKNCAKCLTLIMLLLSGAQQGICEGKLKDLEKEAQTVSKLDWHLMKMNLRLMQQCNYPSKPTFMGIHYDKDKQTVTIQFEVRKSFLKCYRNREGVVDYLKSLCGPMRYLFHDVDSSLDATWKQWLKIKFRQQGGGDGRDIAVYENGAFKVNVPEFLTPPTERSEKKVN